MSFNNRGNAHQHRVPTPSLKEQKHFLLIIPHAQEGVATPSGPHGWGLCNSHSMESSLAIPITTQTCSQPLTQAFPEEAIRVRKKLPHNAAQASVADDKKGAHVFCLPGG